MIIKKNNTVSKIIKIPLGLYIYTVYEYYGDEWIDKYEYDDLSKAPSQFTSKLNKILKSSSYSKNLAQYVNKDLDGILLELSCVGVKSSYLEFKLIYKQDVTSKQLSLIKDFIKGQMSGRWGGSLEQREVMSETTNDIDDEGSPVTTSLHYFAKIWRQNSKFKVLGF